MSIIDKFSELKVSTTIITSKISKSANLIDIAK